MQYLSFWSLLNKKNKFYFYVIIGFITIQALFEILSIAAVIPLVTVILNPEGLNEIKLFNPLKEIINFNKLDNIIPIMSLIFFVIFLIKNILLIIINKIIYTYVFNLKKDLSIKLLEKYLHQDYIFFIKNSFTKIISDIENEVTNLVKSLINPTLIIASELIILIFIILLVILSGYYKTILIIAPFIFLISFILKYLNKNIKSWSTERIKINRMKTSLVYQVMIGIKEIILIGNIKQLLNKFSLFQEKLMNVDINQNVIRMFPKAILEIFAILIFLSTLVFLYYQNFQNEEIIVILSFYLAVAYRLFPSLNKIFINYQLIKFGKPSLKVVNDAMNLEDRIFYFNPEKYEKLKFEKKIEIENINFKFDTRNALFSNINFVINKFEILGIFGESGSGKSTLLNIFSILLRSDSIKFRVDENELKNKIDIRKFQNLVSYISQDSFLLDESIKNNIILGSQKSLDSQKFNEAIEFAQISNFVKTLPSKEDTKVGINSMQISSGQKQRISLARLYYNARDILIFDEATNALDKETEEIIFKNINKLRGKKTIIIVSHDRKNLEICDKIYKLKDNKIELT